MFKFSFIVLLLLLCHVWYRDAFKCLHGLGICVWFYPNKLMMMMMIAGVDTLRSRRKELTRRFFTRPTRAERDILSSLLAAAKAR